MSASKLTKKRRILDASDRFIQLPDELIIIILKKTGDPKTLIRCCLVCKHLQSLVSKVDAVSLRFSYPGEAGKYLPCWKSHDHIPLSAIPAIMKVFAYMKSLKIKLCLCPSLLPCYGVHRGHAFKYKLKAEDMNDKMHTHLCVAIEVGSLSSLYRKRDWFDIEKVKNPLMMSFFLVILSHRPKTLSSVVILSTGIERHGLKRKGGKVFMESEQMARFFTLISDTKVNKSWFKNPQNLVCWIKKDEQNNHRVREKLWLVHKWEGERCNVKKSSIEERDVKELLCAFDEDANNDEKQ
ncbi:PREDICTED: uncharacterized protein LOC105137892 [Populus euphratica]|uniref:Uncharacterized protein LOC105137892 n=1 Tax=Populus euphratica TaxID=75702 RepID=A0AAJ6V6Z8_POPEU|nr:PREDICTED: uncharacterized protein LOC105137892 [Populus euphratica]XP_011042123.1 PREDICTED: uncharacterized protein LOC105137892 [Populus euphratica]